MDTRPSEVSAGRVAELSVSSKARVNAMPILGGETWVLGGGSVFFRVGQLYPQRFANRKRSRVWKIARLKWVHDGARYSRTELQAQRRLCVTELYSSVGGAAAGLSGPQAK